ncbi:MAG: hypothetical protein DSY80_05385 [Desulfocapsa sp.]|nr:MAG: hypothetical protein DSY80_05385 [Desulfocapsa sp.]
MYDYQEQENKIIEKQKELREKLKAMMDDGYSTSSTIMESEAQLNEVIELKRQIIDMAKERDFKMKKSALDINGQIFIPQEVVDLEDTPGFTVAILRSLANHLGTENDFFYPLINIANTLESSFQGGEDRSK